MTTEKNYGSYQITVCCSNCGVNKTSEFEKLGVDILREIDIILTIPKGTTLKQFVSNNKCPNCGCFNCLERREK